MQTSSPRETLLERRQQTTEHSALWCNLTLAQKFAASSLSQFGYKLAFVRNRDIGKLAILLCNGNAATITGQGEIDTTPKVTIRV